jgi:dihydrofolate reductase
MRKLVVSTLVSLDGVIESPNRWANFDEEDTQYAIDQLGDFNAFVMGRVTYEFFRANWADVTGDPYVEKIGTMPKHVASRSLDEVTWNATLLGPDVVGAIERLKAGQGPHQVRRQPPRRHAPARATRGRAAPVDQARRRR